jgi:hypothetical protein
MKVIEIATQADPIRLLAEYQRAYDTLHGHDVHTVARWRNELKKVVPVRSDMKVVVRYTVGEEADGGGYYDVSGEDDAADNWALDLSPWSEWRELEVIDRTGKGLNLDQLAAHLLYEMTWHGWPEEIEAISDGLRDQVEQIDRDIASGVPLEELGYKEYKRGDDIKGFLS